jgi:hypothetical protein
MNHTHSFKAGRGNAEVCACGRFRLTGTPIVEQIAEPRRIVLVYQGGIANVFEVSSFNMSDYGRDAKRLLQGTFGQCELFALGTAVMGAVVHSAHCNMAGAIAGQRWDDNLENAPFSAEMNPVTRNTVTRI